MRRLRNPIYTSIALFCCIVVSHVWLIAPVLQNGDSAVYNDQIERLDLGMRTTHFGYILLGIAFDAALPFGTDANMNFMCLVVGSLGLVALFWIAYRYLGSTRFAMVPVFLGLPLHAYQRGMLLSEVDTVASASTLISLALFLYRQPLIAGLVYGLSMLCTPLVSLSLPLFVLSVPWGGEDSRRDLLEHARRLALFGVSSLLVFGPVVAWHFDDYFFGGRGVLNAPRLPLDLWAGPNRSLRFFTREAGLYLPFVVLGLTAALRERRFQMQGTLAWGLLASTAITAMLGERFSDVPVQLTNLMLSTVVMSQAFYLISRSSQVVWVVTATLGLSMAWASYPAIVRDVSERVDERDRYLAMKTESDPLPMILVGVPHAWNDGRRFERMITKRTKNHRGLTHGEFRNRVGVIQRDEQDYSIWFLTRPRYEDVKPLLGRYRLARRRVADGTYPVLLPKSRP